MPENKRRLKVFLCHASEDKPIVRELFQQLVKKDWVELWFDENSLLPGQDWRMNIEEAVETSDIVIICLSNNSVTKEGYVQKELKYAREIAMEKIDGSIFLIPLRISDCTVPRGLRFYHWVDYFGDKREKTFDELIKSLSFRYNQLIKLDQKMQDDEIVVELGEIKAKNLSAKIEKQKKTANVFISYRRFAKEDRGLAEYLSDQLSKDGHKVFIDTSMRAGTEWLKEIDNQIRTSDYLIVLISKDSADSEMVQAEIQRAYEYRREFGHPQTLPVRMRFDGLLPYTISAFISSYQQISWQTIDDNEKITRQISEAIDDQQNKDSLLSLKIFKPISFSEDGRPMYSNKEEITPPLPEFDSRVLDELDAPGGALKLSDRFYIERDADEKLRRFIIRTGETITVRASRQTGKSSLIVRGVHHARTKAKVVHIDMQSIEQRDMESADRFARYLAGTIVRKLRLENETLEKIWREKLGPQDKLTKVIEDYVIPNVGEQIIMAIDEADRLLSVPFHSDFFALIRSWHNNRAIDDLWNKLNIVMVIATEPYLLIADPTQSPFNVGLKVDLTDFNQDQVRDLNDRHGNPIKEENIQPFFDLLGGHPYLTRKALYMLVSEHWTWKKLLQDSNYEQGPFGDHLRRQLWLLKEDQPLRFALYQVIRQNRCDNDVALLRLLRAGLIKGRGDAFYCRCGLYEQFFKDKLK